MAKIMATKYANDLNYEPSDVELGSVDVFGPHDLIAALAGLPKEESRSGYLDARDVQYVTEDGRKVKKLPRHYVALRSAMAYSHRLQRKSKRESVEQR
jgi:hypothetical protein